MVSKTGYPANTDIAPESSKREGYFSGPPKIKFQNTSRQNDVCHMLLSTDKNLPKSGRNGWAGRDGRTSWICTLERKGRKRNKTLLPKRE